MDLMKLVARLTLDSSEFDSGIQRAKSSMPTLSAGAVAVGNLISSGFSAATEALKNFGGRIMDAGQSFESTMSQVGAISGATSSELDVLSSKAKEMGATTKFSATEAGEAFTYMAMAGWKTDDMLGGIKGIMDLAAASGENLATTSDIVTDALTAFGMEANRAGEFADVLAAASSNSNTNVSMLGESFKYVAPLAGAMKYSAEDVAIALGLMANAGIKGSQAGTSMRGILTRLIKPTKESQSALDNLGISITDSQGKARPLNEVLDIMRSKFSDLTETEKTQYAALIAGQEGMSGLLSIVNASTEDYDNLSQAIYYCDDMASQMAGTMNGNLKGGITMMNSALESLALTFYDAISDTATESVNKLTEAVGVATSKMQEWLGRESTQQKIQAISEKVLELVDSFVNNLDPILDTVISGFEMLVDAATFVVEHFHEIINTVKIVIEGFIAFKAAMAAVQIAQFVSNLVSLAAAFGPVGVAVTALIATLALLVTKWDDVKRGAQLVVQDIKNAWEGLKQFFSDVANGIVQAFSQVSPTLGAIFEQAFTTIKAVWDTVGAYFGAVWDTIKGVFAVVKDVLSGDFSAAWEAIKGIVGTWVNYFKQIWENIKKVFSAVANTFKTFFSDAWKAVQTVWNVATKFFGDIFEGIVKTFSSIPGKIGEFFSSAWEKAKQAWSNVTGFFSEVGNNILSIFTQLPEKFTHIGKWIVEGLWKGINSMVEWISGKIKGFTDSVITGFKNFFGIASPSKVMEKEVGRFIGMGVGQGIMDEADYVQKSFDSIMPDFKKPTYSLGTNEYGGPADGANGYSSNYTININVDGAKYGDSRQLAEAISLELQNLLDRRRAVFA